jgi:hypothetical protein
MDVTRTGLVLVMSHGASRQRRGSYIRVETPTEDTMAPAF